METVQKVNNNKKNIMFAINSNMSIINDDTSFNIYNVDRNIYISIDNNSNIISKYNDNIPISFYVETPSNPQREILSPNIPPDNSNFYLYTYIFDNNNNPIKNYLSINDSSTLFNSDLSKISVFLDFNVLRQYS